VTRLPVRPDMLTLRHRRFWIVASVLLVAAVVVGSLQTAFATGVMRGFDKVEHFGTYMFLAVWFTGLYRRRRYWLVAAGLLALGLSMEIAQFVMQAGRMGDPYDMAANTGGVAAGLLLACVATGGWAERLEAWLAR
jgi:VanZ family protein